MALIDSFYELLKQLDNEYAENINTLSKKACLSLLNDMGLNMFKDYPLIMILKERIQSAKGPMTESDLEDIFRNHKEWSKSKEAEENNSYVVGPASESSLVDFLDDIGIKHSGISGFRPGDNN
jgi:hypothetical protein